MQRLCQNGPQKPLSEVERCLEKHLNCLHWQLTVEPD